MTSRTCALSIYVPPPFVADEHAVGAPRLPDPLQLEVLPVAPHHVSVPRLFWFWLSLSLSLSLSLVVVVVEVVVVVVVVIAASFVASWLRFTHIVGKTLRRANTEPHTTSLTTCPKLTEWFGEFRTWRWSFTCMRKYF